MPDNSNDCEFCNELTDFSSSRVGKIYAGHIENRIFAESENFVVMPTIGQIINGSLLILPRPHFETFSEIGNHLQLEAGSLIKKTGERYLKNAYLIFEHGAKKVTGSNCGVFHAHMHLVPFASEADMISLVGMNANSTLSLQNAWDELTYSNNYILASNSGGKVYYMQKNEVEKYRFSSQYFRKWLVEHGRTGKEWDWKKYNYVEQSLINTLA